MIVLTNYFAFFPVNAAVSFLDHGMFLVGPEGSKANPLQAVLRAVLTYGFAVLLVRLGHTRSIGRNNGIDIILSVILGSVLSRAVNGNSSIASTFAACVALMAVHWVAAAVTFHSKAIGKLLKGEPSTLVENGRMLPETMRRSHISDDDLIEALRTQGQLDDVGRVEKARLERNGEISVLEKKPSAAKPRILEITVAAGVQTVRVELQ